MTKRYTKAFGTYTNQQGYTQEAWHILDGTTSIGAYATFRKMEQNARTLSGVS